MTRRSTPRSTPGLRDSANGFACVTHAPTNKTWITITSGASRSHTPQFVAIRGPLCTAPTAAGTRRNRIARHGPRSRPCQPSTPSRILSREREIRRLDHRADDFAADSKATRPSRFPSKLPFVPLPVPCVCHGVPVRSKPAASDRTDPHVRSLDDHALQRAIAPGVGLLVGDLRVTVALCGQRDQGAEQREADGRPRDVVAGLAGVLAPQAFEARASRSARSRRESRTAAAAVRAGSP